MVCALVRRVSDEEVETDSDLKTKMKREFREKGDFVRLMSGIGMSENKETGRVECHYPKFNQERRRT